MHVAVSSSAVRPLLKWAGGKRQLLPRLEEHYPPRFNQYIEPFVGSGAVFFHLAASRALEGHAVHLSDMNADLIGCYRTVRDRPAAVVRALAALEREHREHGDACYYDVRDRRFNPERAALLQKAGDESALAAAYPARLAAMLIFLNRTGFNGLFRLNRRGLFNVPAGRYAEPRICDVPHVRQIAGIFSQPGVAIDYRPFEQTIANAGDGDFVYCDPPYAPLSRTASFANYTAHGFTPDDQMRLQQAVIAACRRGAQVVVSNSSAADILAIYTTREARDAGLVIRRVAARRAINSRATSRGPVDELIITNVPPGPRNSDGQAFRGARPARPKLRMAKMRLKREL